MATRKSKGSFWGEWLRTTRIILKPECLIDNEFRLLSPKAVGVFLRLLPYAAHSLPVNVKSIARFAGVSDKVMARVWPELEPLFERRDTLYVLRPSDWFTVQSVSVERQRLRHLLDTLVAFWGSACVYCGDEASELEIEHIVPITRGGTDELTNLTLACKKCNMAKRTKTAAEFGHPHIHELAKRIQ